MHKLSDCNKSDEKHKYCSIYKISRQFDIRKCYNKWTEVVSSVPLIVVIIAKLQFRKIYYDTRVLCSTLPSAANVTDTRTSPKKPMRKNNLYIISQTPWNTITHGYYNCIILKRIIR